MATDNDRPWLPLLEQALTLPQGGVRLAILEEAVRMADAHRDPEASFFMRQELMNSAMGAGRPETLLVHFAWCLAQCDREPQRFDEGHILWQYATTITNKMR